MGHTSGIRSPFALLALLALAALAVICAVLFAVAALFGSWAYPLLGAIATYIFCRRMTMEQRDCLVLAGCGASAGFVTAWSASAIGGVGGAIAAMFIGALVLAVLIVIAMFILHWDV